MRKKKKPKFNVMNLGFQKRVKDRWRKPRGVANKKRRRYAFAGASPRIGYRNPPKLRGIHPKGKNELLVKNPAQLENTKDVLIRIAGSVGKKKRVRIIERARQLNLTVLNP